MSVVWNDKYSKKGGDGNVIELSKHTYPLFEHKLFTAYFSMPNLFACVSDLYLLLFNNHVVVG